MTARHDNFLACAGREETLAEVAARFGAWERGAGVEAPERLAVVAEDPRVLLAAAVGLHARQADGAVVAGATATPEVRRLLMERGVSVLEIGPEGAWARLERAPAGAGAPPEAGRVTILTSGTTGIPKLHAHTWASLATLRAGAAPPPHRWLLTYLPGTYAWFQMVTLWMFHAGQTLVASPHTAPEEVWDDGLVAGFDAVSSTPSFWRYLFALRPPAELARAPLAQITLGGEPVRQDLLDRLAALFPAARLTHIYASTEVGAAIVVHDGREGFPARWLEEAAPPGRPALRVVDGVLHVRSPHAARGSAGADGWCATGDRVERRGHRAVVVGRAAGELGGDLLGDLLNVGGRKVAPAAVAGQLAASPLVAWCRVRGARAPLVGTLVAADVVLSPHGRELAPEAAERELTAFCAARGLPDWMVPRLWNWLERVPLTAAGKEERPAAERQAEVAPPIKAEVDA